MVSPAGEIPAQKVGSQVGKCFHNSQNFIVIRFVVSQRAAAQQQREQATQQATM